MTINKAQGQEFEKVGLFLPSPCFSHGQLYTAFSRARALDEIRVKIESFENKQGSYDEDGKTFYVTQNVVYTQVLTAPPPPPTDDYFSSAMDDNVHDDEVFDGLDSGEIDLDPDNNTILRNPDPFVITDPLADQNPLLHPDPLDDPDPINDNIPIIDHDSATDTVFDPVPNNVADDDPNPFFDHNTISGSAPISNFTLERFQSTHGNISSYPVPDPVLNNVPDPDSDLDHDIDFVNHGYLPWVQRNSCTSRNEACNKQD